MASGNLNLPPPQPFIPGSSDASIRWQEWREYFMNYISAYDEDNDFSGEKKKKILLHCLGPHGFKIYNRIEKKQREQGDVFVHALEDLDRYYSPTVCVGIDLYKFFHRKQNKEEMIEEYVSALKNLALTCKFGTLHDEFIRDQIVMHAANQNIQDCLWTKGESPLQEVIEVVKKAELTGRCATSVLQGNSKVDDSIGESHKLVNRVIESKKCPPNEFSRKTNSYRNKKSKRDTSKVEVTCFRCGLLGHYANDKSCPARNQKCSGCGTVGHFIKVCKKKKGTAIKLLEDASESASSSDSEDKNMWVLNIRNAGTGTPDGLRKRPKCDISIEGVTITITADSGSPYTIVNEQVWFKKLRRTVGGGLDTPDISPKSFTGETIQLLGYKKLSFAFKDHKAECKMYVSKSGPSVLGGWDQGALGMVLNPNGSEPVSVVQEDSVCDATMKDMYPLVFSGTRES
ncbi:hypothetical protein NDU88_009601 [Pleurodeles waltl]|uniref:CCHC-type domain-containing protein n=1 Tax=Pleurodeles waltl TaxID=8319 RepID=A0AAV7PSJ7_PLEWA|nr:hypothetical protein NDU88_009601 [Pleurodeles waltl]